MATIFKACAVDGCKQNAHFTARGRGGYCSGHYGRKRRHGDPLGGNASRGEPLEWLHAHSEHANDDCLYWPFAASAGRGQVWVNGRSMLAARVMCTLVHGAPPEASMDAAHSCGKGHEGCVNPRHLRWATRSENIADMVPHGTATRGERGGLAKLSEDDVWKIYALLESGMKQREIAERYEIDPSTVSNLNTGKRWGWLRDTM